MFEFNSGIICGELPVYPFLHSIPISVPFLEFRVQGFQIINSPFTQALFCQCR